MFLCQRMAPVRLDSRIAGRGEVFFSPNGCHSVRWLPGPDPGYFFRGEKVTKTPPGTPRSPIVYLNRFLSVLGHLCTESGFCHLIYSGSINETSAAALLKGDMFLLVLGGDFFHI